MAAAISLAVLWLFIFGDDTWPAHTELLPIALFLGTFGAAAYGFLNMAYEEGKKQEGQPSLPRRHLAYALGLTFLLIALPAVYEWRVGNFFANPGPAEVCAGFCRDKGFAASGAPPADTGAGVCTCYDGQGRAALSASMAQVQAQRK